MEIYEMNDIKINGSFKAVSFWNAVKIYCQHPKSINKEVLFSENVFIAELDSLLRLNECFELFKHFCCKLSNSSAVDGFKKIEKLSECKILNNIESVFFLSNKMYLIVRKLVPKLNVNDESQFFEFIFLDKEIQNIHIFTNVLKKAIRLSNTKTLDPLVILKFNFLQLTWKEEFIKISYDKNLKEKGVTWLNATFAPKFKKLLLSADICRAQNRNSSKLKFDSKVDIVQYYKFYEKMKSKYAKYFVENWTENTDPKKFVYEDIGIATYLLMLWNGGNIPDCYSKKQKFIDLGCGNGLLVHILNSEGYFGVGLDLRKRKIWKIFPSTTVLREEVIIPSKETIYPEADWLIGNHSDELTAWIPIMARLSNNRCNYFVLPCCSYKLNGTKYQRKNSGFSCYQDFINYVEEISKLCEFQTHVDKLRIPSTKRICLIGFSKSGILEKDYCGVKDKIINFIEAECNSVSNGNCKNEENQVSINFKVREPVELVKNCTKLSTEFVDDVLKIIMEELLKEYNPCTVERNGAFVVWNRGKKLAIGELASHLKCNMLKQLKSECKGLQTLIKNHHFLFKVSQGFVQFRSPESMLELCNKVLGSQSNMKWKIKKCWLFYNHPDKCPLSDVLCSYKHDKMIE